MNKIISLIYILSGFFLLASCDKDATNVKLPKDIKPMLIVHSFISPDDTITGVFVSKTTPIYGVKRSFRDYDPVPNAQVKVREKNGNWAILKFEPIIGFYYVDHSVLKIEKGKTYELEVMVDGMEKVTATCTVPSGSVPNPSIDQITVKKEKQQWGDSVFNYSIRTQWQDLPEIGNYYRIDNKILMKTAQLDYNPVTGQYDTTYTDVEFEAWERYFNKYFEDDQKNGSKISSTWRFQIWPSWTGIPDTVKAIRGHLLLTDENYYRYHINQEKALEANGNPFAEPVVLKGNIEGGIGIFAAYLSKEYLINL